MIGWFLKYFGLYTRADLAEVYAEALMRGIQIGRGEGR